MRSVLLLLLVSLVPLVYAIDIPDIPDTPAGLESGDWYVESWGNPGALEHVESKGKKLLKLIYVPGGKEKAAFRHNTGIGVARKGKITLQFYTEKAVDVSLALSTTSAYVYHEAKRMTSKPGWNKLEFDVSAAVWKTASSEWNYTQEIDSPGDIRAIDLLVYNQKLAGDAYVLGLQYDADEPTKEAEKLAKDLSSDDADKRAKSEKALLALGTPAIEVLSQIAARDDKPEVQIRAQLLLKALQTAPTAAPAEPLQPRLVPPGAAGVGEANEQLARGMREMSGARRAAALPEVLANAEKQLAALHAELSQIHEQTAALLKTVDEAAALVKQLDEKNAPKAEEKPPEKNK